MPLNAKWWQNLNQSQLLNLKRLFWKDPISSKSMKHGKNMHICAGITRNVPECEVVPAKPKSIVETVMLEAPLVNQRKNMHICGITRGEMLDKGSLEECDVREMEKKAVVQTNKPISTLP
jgi:hypothetical protein